RAARVEVRGLEPLTLCLQSRCATNCAIPPCGSSPSHRIGVLGPFGLGGLVPMPPPEEDSESHEREAAQNPSLHDPPRKRSEEHTSELQSRFDLVCRLLLE